MRKTKDFTPNACPVTHTLNKIGGKWKPVILYLVTNGCNRFSGLQRAIPAISKQMLVNQLRELETDAVVERHVFAQVPPKVEYQLTPYGASLLPIIGALREWGMQDMQKAAACVE